MNTLEGFVAAWLAENKVKRQVLADSTGCSLVTFNRRVSGESDMTIGFARELAKAMNVSVDEVCRMAHHRISKPLRRLFSCRSRAWFSRWLYRVALSGCCISGRFEFCPAFHGVCRADLHIAVTKLQVD